MWGRVFEQSATILLGGGVVVLAAWLAFRRERNERRRDKLHDALVNLVRTTRKLRLALLNSEHPYDEVEVARGTKESEELLKRLSDDLIIATAYARSADGRFKNQLLEIENWFTTPGYSHIQAVDELDSIAQYWLKHGRAMGSQRWWNRRSN